MEIESTEPGPQRPVRPRKAWVAALLSLWVTGLGHLYAGAWKRAVVLPVLVPLLLWSLAFTGLPNSFPGFLVWLALALLCYLAVIGDAIRLARRGRDYRLRPFNRWYLYLLIGLLVSWLSLPGALVERLPVRTFKSPSQSMEPAIQLGDHLLADVTYWQDHAPARGDLVVFSANEPSDALLIKRVVGLPGESIAIRNKRVFVNGAELQGDWGVHRDSNTFPDSPFGSSAGRLRDHFGPLDIPAGTVFLLGDNRDFSYDSRFFGPVPLQQLHAKPLFLFWAADRSRIGRSLGVVSKHRL